MEQNARQERGYTPNVIRLCIDRFDYDLKGRIYTKICEQPVEFESCGDMFLKTDEIFDKCGFPQSFQEKRKFSSQRSTGRYLVPKVLVEDEMLRRKSGKIKTFDIFIRSRRSVGWQGFIMNEKGQKVFDFQGEMELLNHIRTELQNEPQDSENPF